MKIIHVFAVIFAGLCLLGFFVQMAAAIYTAGPPAEPMVFDTPDKFVAGGFLTLMFGAVWTWVAGVTSGNPRREY